MRSPFPDGTAQVVVIGILMSYKRSVCADNIKDAWNPSSRPSDGISLIVFVEKL